MKAIEVSQSGSADVLHLVEKPTPTPGPGQVLIEVKAAGINFADLVARAGNYPPAPKPPFVPGLEVAGIVHSVGDGVTTHKPGDRVAAMLAAFGGYAEYAVADVAQAAILPDNLGFAEATALLVQGLTAYGLMTAAVPGVEGKSVLISAAAGGVGSLAVQIAKLLGAGTVIGLASTEEKRAQVKELGADFVIDYTQANWAEQIKSVTGGLGVDVYLDASGDNKNGGLKVLSRGGAWVIYGAQSSSETGLTGMDLVSLIFGGQTIRGYSLYEAGPEGLATMLTQLFTWYADGKLTIIARDKFPLAQAADAHRAIEGRKTTGKVVLEP